MNIEEALRKQCEDWEKLYIQVVQERDAWKERALAAEEHEAKLAEKNEDQQRKLRHV